jgi:plasmid stability protein
VPAHADERGANPWLNGAVEPSGTESSPDRLRLTVDEVVEVAYDPAQPGAYHYTRLTGPAPGYGFSVRRSDHARSTTAEHVERIRGFLSEVDPTTGYLEDDSHDQRDG